MIEIGGEEYLNTVEVMEETGLGYSTVCKYAATGIFKGARKLDKRGNSPWLIPASGVKGWEGRVNPRGRPKKVEEPKSKKGLIAYKLKGDDKWTVLYEGEDYP